ncbi:hypothetical protein CL176_02530 [Suicoccus acidiformans]|uniref:Integrase catalytic domain-containing protein n=1 Tax=Suicoccus acidiformans TaxID=2036206 RepID=A0A347WIT4_9LACT|nr:hypothetical protein CL176_02530 [Suicoccus acidiformans]
MKMIEKEGVERFKTMTTDNGSEFSTLSNLEHQCEETRIYFTHAYAGWDKGTNEGHNRILCKFLPKGESLRELIYRYLQTDTNTIHHCYRRILNYQCLNEVYKVGTLV